MRWYAGLQNGKVGIGGRLPWKISYGESTPPFAVVAERLNSSEAHKTGSIHRLVPSGSRTPFSCSRRTSGKSLFTSMRAAWPALMARDSPLSTGPFCCGVYGTVSARRVWRLLQYSTNAELVYSGAVIRPECPWSSHVGNEPLHHSEDGRCALVPCPVWALKAGSAVHKHDDVPRASK